MSKGIVEEIASQKNNFSISLFDIIGPIMIGPSSSHTAGAARIGYAAYGKLGKIPDSVTIKLYNSFADTGKGHKTDVALLAGAIGIRPDDLKIKDAFKIADKLGVKYSISWDNYDKNYHPNTAVVIVSKGKSSATVVGFSIGGGNIILLDKVDDGVGNEVTRGSYPSFIQLRNLVNESKTSLKEVVQKIEENVSGDDQKVQKRKMAEIWEVMMTSIDEGFKDDRRAISNMYGGDGKKLSESNSICISKTVRDGVGASIAVAEYNARMGKIVASPTAGSCGIIPGVLYSLVENKVISEEMAKDSLFIGASIGAIVSAVMNLAGAVAGCQAEIGVAGAMAAASATWALGGGIGQIESSASFVLSNVLGLTCDPIDGVVQVPCILRNGAITAMVFTSVDLALAGAKYPIPFDEIVLVAKETGDKMCSTLKETSKGGLAKTNTAVLHNKFCNICPNCC